MTEHATTPQLDPSRLRAFLDGRWASVREMVREQAKDPLFHPVYDLPVDEYRERVLQQLRAIAKTEGPRLLFPKEYGGEGDIGGAVTAFEMLGAGDLSLLTKAGVQFGLFGGAVLHLGNEEHRQRYLRPTMDAELLGCFAMTETGHGSDVQHVRTTAIYDRETEEFVLNTPDEDGRKDYIGNAADHGHMAVVFAQLITGGEGHGVHAFLVPIREDGEVVDGVTIEDCGHKGGMNGVDNGRIWFDEVRVPRSALLDRYGQVDVEGLYSSPIESDTKRFFTTVGTLVQGRISVSGAAVSAAKVALTIAVRYGLARRQFENPATGEEVVILDFRQHQRRLLPRLAKTYALHFAQEALVEKLDEAFSDLDAYPEDEKRRLEALAAGVKATTTWHATDTIQTCREACGGAGYLSENRLMQLKADSDVFTTFEGDNTVLMQLVARGLLTDFRDEFAAMDTFETVRFVADQAVETIIERTAARQLFDSLVDAVGRDEEADLLERGTQLELFQWREEHVVNGVARRLKRGIDNGRDPFEVFNEAQDHVLLAARVHIDRVILERFIAAIDRCEDDEVRTLLEAVCDLYALSTIEDARAWYLEHGRLTATRAKAVVATVGDLCTRLRPHARTLVDAFGIPDEILAAPIALGEEA
ncbi:MAG: acyl-CoA dehydrogenase, partial [Nitriliruptorales bacterium]|nr:acyl-CoA dehydrogenase [Nitriliruptorales bacterium]